MSMYEYVLVIINALEGVALQSSLHDAVCGAVRTGLNFGLLSEEQFNTQFTEAWNNAMMKLHGADVAYAEELGMGCF